MKTESISDRSASSGTVPATSEAARQLRKALGISQDFDDWPITTLMLKAAERIVADGEARHGNR